MEYKMEIIYLFLILLFGFVVFLIFTMRKAIVNVNNTLIASKSNLQTLSGDILNKLDASQEIALLPSYPIAGTSLEGISFYEFIEARDLEKLKKLELKSADVIVTDILEKLGFQGTAGYGVQLVSSIKHVLAVDREEVSITFTKEAMKKLRLGSASFVKDKKTGLIIPQLRDAATGKFIEQGRLVYDIKSLPEIMRQIGPSALPGLIAISHMISNYEVSKDLKQIGKNIEFLKSARLYDQKAELIASFGKLQQAFSLPEPHRTIELGKIHFDLQKLRNVWVMEIEGTLADLKDTRAQLIRNTPLFRASESRKNQQELNNVRERLSLMGYSSRLDAIAITMGNVKVYDDDELRPLKKIETLLQKSYEALPNLKIRESARIELDTAFEMIKDDSSLLFSSKKEIVSEQ